MATEIRNAKGHVGQLEMSVRTRPYDTAKERHETNV